ncbi:hypothetical protein QUF56_11315 [Ureibacillus composti]|nr:hypothetical protein [Ureibacillus composti]
MYKAFHRIFWGYLIVWIEIHLFVIDILADPVGYYLIYSGISHVIKDFPIGHKAKKLAMVLVFISLPTVFVQQNLRIDQLTHLSMFSGWTFYTTLLSLLKFILVFYIFQLIMAIVQLHGDERMIRRSSRTFIFYVIGMFFVLCLNTFMINLPVEILLFSAVVSVIGSLILEIVFLLLLRSVSEIKIEPN